MSLFLLIPYLPWDALAGKWSLKTDFSKSPSWLAPKAHIVIGMWISQACFTAEAQGWLCQSYSTSAVTVFTSRHLIFFHSAVSYNLYSQQAPVNAQISLLVKPGSIKVWFSAVMPACGPRVIPQNVTGIHLVLHPLFQMRSTESLVPHQMSAFQIIPGP